MVAAAAAAVVAAVVVVVEGGNYRKDEQIRSGTQPTIFEVFLRVLNEG